MNDPSRIVVESPSRPGVIVLIKELDAPQKPHYPPESHHGIDSVLSRSRTCSSRWHAWPLVKPPLAG